MIKGQVIGGDFSKIVIRKRSEADLELGEILVSDSGHDRILMQVYDLQYGSQVSQQNIEMISGLSIEQGEEFTFMEPELRNYTIAIAKLLLVIRPDGTKYNSYLCKTLPGFFSEVRSLEKEDLAFMSKPSSPVFMGEIRSGSDVVDFPIELDGKDVLSHHILIAATTGRGKSNLTSCILWKMLNESYSGLLVLDPHDEYYGRNSYGLKDHPNSAEKMRYYTSLNPPKGSSSLKISLSSLRPSHFSFINLSDPQRQAASAYYRKYRTDWIVSLLYEKPLDVDFNESTINVLRRRLMDILGIEVKNGNIYTKSIFSVDSGESTIDDICRHLQESKTVIIDTSHFSGDVELLIGNMIASDIFKRYKNFKMMDELKRKPVVSIVLEEAPRVLGKDVLEKGTNIFSSIAREGRKFKIGLLAITQLPSLIPRDILANLNTKIILGIEMSNERQSIIESSAQDLSNDSRAIASLDKGEALITSNFARFAIPVKFPLFKKVVEETQNRVVKEKYSSDNGFKTSFQGIGGP